MELVNISTEEKEHLCFLLKDIEHPVAILNEDGVKLQLNNAFRKTFGIDIEKVRDLLDGSSKALWDECFQETLIKGRATLDVHMPLLNERIVQANVRLIYYRQSRQVTALFEVTSCLSGAEKVKRLFRKSDNLMFVVDRNGRVRDVNELTLEYFNLPRDYFLGQSVRKIFLLFSKSSSESCQYIHKVVKDGYAEVVKRYEQSPGNVKYFTIFSFYDEETGMYIMRIRDDTEKVLLEQQLDHQKSLAEVGQLAAGIIHEIRNPMTTLKGFTQLLRSSSPEETKKYLNVIEEEIIRMEAILSEMLVLSKPSSNEKNYLSLHSLLDDIKRIVLPTANLEGIQIIQKEDNFSDVLVFGDESKLKQVVLNLFKNAYEAMESGGVLTTEVKEADDGHIQLIVSDTGKGMSSTQIKQVFMPFFTTRQEGTGLGLPLVLKTIEEHGGTITVESEVGYGSSFIISFPPEIVQVSKKTAKETALFKPS